MLSVGDRQGDRRAFPDGPSSDANGGRQKVPSWSATMHYGVVRAVVSGGADTVAA